MERWSWDAPPQEVAAAVARGALVAIPTESSYGLAVNPRDAAAVEAVYRVKARDAGKPLPVVVASPADVALLGVAPELPEVVRLASCWPAALTAVLPRLPGAPHLPAAAGGATVAVRVPDHGPLRRLLAVTGPLTATSANPSGEEPVLDPAALGELLAGEDALLVDGGVLPGGAPSTLIAFDGDGRWRVLRPGRVQETRLRECLAVPAPSGS